MNNITCWFVSGLRVVYNLHKPNDHRVHSVQVLCTDCPFSEYIDLQEDVVYTFLTVDFLAKGGDGYNMTAAEEMVYLGEEIHLNNKPLICFKLYLCEWFLPTWSCWSQYRATTSNGWKSQLYDAAL